MGEASLSLILSSKAAFARDIPSNVAAFYVHAKNAGTCSGSDLLQGGFHDTDDGPTSYGYCNRYMGDTGFYLKGPNKELVNMDIDCDGEQTSGDGRCGSSEDTQGQTAFQEEVSQYGISDLNAYIHPYVVLGNEGNYDPTFDPREHGVEPLSIVAVVCNGKLVYGIWGDTNGDDGKPLVGEASLATATACFGEEMNGDNGHDEKDVLYIAFSGKEAVPGDKAKWDAESYDEFEESIAELGDKLVAGLGKGMVSGFHSNATSARMRRFHV
ncbi:chitosanase [Aspergillus steynii IBT 23096]|uniref:Endo-chitosanase n=1 Tax=Aspergillus steynii IBT 23096 TaxID=1392250 RepID=A0A2I2G111_9EURO|nr:chitosanase [Aspergillus steynii IBT 23096]PLB46569.1 chitosanase [Aspergillus steynii IBT 23096]